MGCTQGPRPEGQRFAGWICQSRTVTTAGRRDGTFGPAPVTRCGAVLEGSARQSTGS